MTGVDRLLQRWRIRRARKFIRRGARVLDIGCADGTLFVMLGDTIESGVGIDPDAVRGAAGARGQLYPGTFPDALPDEKPFDVICLLAVLEHIPEAGQRALAAGCMKVLKPGGKVVVTVPAPAVDHILNLLQALRLIHGMSLEQHYGFKPSDLPERFTGAGLRLLAHRRFQLGLNHLFVFERPSAG